MTIEHTYFGIINTPDDDSDNWEQEIEFNGQLIDAYMVLGKDALTPENLDKLAHILQHLAKTDDIAQANLIKYLNEDDGFMSSHLDEIEDREILDELRNDPTVANFVNAMNITGLMIWEHVSGGVFVTFDYVIDSEYSDQILAVTFDIDGEFQEIVWES